MKFTNSREQRRRIVLFEIRRSRIFDCEWGDLPDDGVEAFRRRGGGLCHQLVDHIRPWHVLRVEREESRRHDRNTSRLLNYLDVTIDLNAGDLFRARRLDKCWLGFLIDHRSGAFGLIDIFGRVNGGSNYNSGYIECTF